MRDAADEACEALWFAVIRQAVEDVRLIPRWEDRIDEYHRRMKHARNASEMSALKHGLRQAEKELKACKKSRDWILYSNGGFNTVCRVLNLDPDTARPILVKAMDSDEELGNNLLRSDSEKGRHVCA